MLVNPKSRMDFKSLQKIWYEKLKKSGFNDAEETKCGHERLKDWHSFKFRNSKERKETSEAYYQKAFNLLNTYKFKNDTHRAIWEMHSEGWPKRRIEKAIANMTPTYKREQIGNIINTISKEIS